MMFSSFFFCLIQALKATPDNIISLGSVAAVEPEQKRKEVEELTSAPVEPAPIAATTPTPAPAAAAAPTSTPASPVKKAPTPPAQTAGGRASGSPTSPKEKKKEKKSRGCVVM